MPIDDNGSTIPDAPESVSEPSESIFNDPFDYSDEAENFDDGIDFQMNDDGELELQVPKEESSEEKSTEEEPQEDGFDPFGNVEEQSRRITAQEQLDTQNRQLQERIDKLEKEIAAGKQKETLTQSQQEYRTKLESAGFSDEQIEVIMELRAKDEVQTKEPTEQELQHQSELEVQKEASAVLSKYNGQNGLPSAEIMRPWTDYVLAKFPNEAKRFPLPALFRIAENAPFMHWIENHPQLKERASKASLRDMLMASENLRKEYYKKHYNRTDNRDYYEHLFPRKEEETNTEETSSRNNGQKMNAETARRLAAAKNERSLNVPGGEVEEEDTLSERRRPKTAYEIAKATVDSFM